ncbi:helix-turn-helix domain-containing protein [Arthrobacter sp. NPDC058130]|uniref:helix-turn-helix domain-containing protein n=1 Tax=Arthrobacter sp. NPDC058130 TaxID=3346353 RepID=UPI0036EE29E1
MPQPCSTPSDLATEPFRLVEPVAKKPRLLPGRDSHRPGLEPAEHIVQDGYRSAVRFDDGYPKESLVFTGEDSPMANLMLSVMGAFAEIERSLIRERQREGIALAQQRGAYKGRKKTLTPERAAELVQRAVSGVPKAVLARDYGISRETVYQYLRQAKLS